MEKIVKGTIVVALLGSLFFMFHHYMSIGEARTIGAIILVFALICTALATLERFNKLCTTPHEQQLIEIRRQKYAAELAAAVAVTGVAISLWFVFSNFDVQNTRAKFQRLVNAQNQLENVLTLEFCKSKPYRELWCAALKKNEQELFWLIIDGNNGKIENKLQSLLYTLDGMAGETDRNVVAAAYEAKEQLNHIVGLGERHRTSIAIAMLTILLIAGCRAVSGKVAIAAFEYYQVLPTSPAKPIVLFEFMKSLKYRSKGNES